MVDAGLGRSKPDEGGPDRLLLCRRDRHHDAHPALRHDIQFLRGVAVLAVLLCHAFPLWFPYGYLGVDLFFVISGFLMTKMIAKPGFTFSSFYVRRARRLLPAAFVTLAISTAVARVTLSTSDWAAFLSVLLASITFTANMVRPDAYVHPLAHMWSLSLEEQFYFVYPVLLVCFGSKRSIWWLLALAGASFVGWLAIRGDNAFYLLPFRAWELLGGGALFFAGFTKPLPLELRPLERIGDWSYSLYLIHWPLIAFASVFAGWPLPPSLATAICFVSVALAALQYDYVEQRFRLTSVAGDRPAVEVAAP